MAEKKGQKSKHMTGFNRLLKMYGKIHAKDQHGNVTIWVWDYYKNEPRIEEEMTLNEKRLSEHARYN